jgi:hypothetical protein
LLDDSDIWTKNYFDPNNAKKHRREMFFANPENAWSGKAPLPPGGASPATKPLPTGSVEYAMTMRTVAVARRNARTAT